MVQKPSESIDWFTEKSTKTCKVLLKKIDFSKTTKPKLGFSPLKLKIHKKVSRHITTKKVDKKEEIQVEPLRSFVFNRLSTLHDFILPTSVSESFGWEGQLKIRNLVS